MLVDDQQDLITIAENVLLSNRYLTLATCGRDRKPWAAPMMYAVDKSDRFYWVSAVDCSHSQDISENSDIAFVIFDSNPGYGNAQALYCAAIAEQLSGTDLEIGCDVFYRMRYPDASERDVSRDRNGIFYPASRQTPSVW
jgi:uncharacterized protein YhbP (UPF0306 family)